MRRRYNRVGRRGAAPYPDPDESKPLTDDQLAVVKDRTATQFVGDPDEVADRLAALQRVTGADELVITSVTHRHEDRLRSLRAPGPVAVPMPSATGGAPH